MLQFSLAVIVVLAVYKILPLCCFNNGVTSSLEKPTLASFVNRIGDYYGLTSIIVFYNSQCRVKNEIDLLLIELYQNSSSYFASKVQISGTELSQMRLAFAVPTTALIIIFARNWNDPIIETVAQSCRGRRASHAIFIMEVQLCDSERQRFFTFLWRKQFRKPLLVHDTQNGMLKYTISPYPTLKVVNVTNATPQRCFPADHNFNFQGYLLRVPVQLDIPQTFWFFKRGIRKLDGIGGRFFRTLMKRLNVTLITYALEPEPNYLNISKLTQLLEKESFEINPHLLTMIDSMPHIEYSYPYVITRRCFMLPLNNEIPRNLYLLLPFTPGVWIMIGLFIACLTLIIELLQLDKNRDFHLIPLVGAGFFWALSIILARPGEIDLVHRYRRVGCLKALRSYACFLILSFAGIYIAQTYASSLTSFLTVTLFGRPSTSVSSLLAASQAIMIVRSEEEAIMSSLKFPDPAFRKLFTYADSYEYNFNRYSLNRSFVYPISSERWEFLNEQQRLLRRKRFWLSDICFGEYPMQFQLQDDSQFYAPLQFFILWVYESGLHNYWSSKSFYRAKKMGYVCDFKNNEDIENETLACRLSLKLLLPCFYVFLVGHALSVCLLLLELAYVKLHNALQKYRY